MNDPAAPLEDTKPCPLCGNRRTTQPAKSTVTATGFAITAAMLVAGMVLLVIVGVLWQALKFAWGL